MKKTKYGILLAIMVAAYSNSCTDLDETVYSEVPVDKFGTNMEQVNALVGSVYSTFKAHIPVWDSYVTLDELSGDMMAVPGFKGGDWGEPMFRQAMQHTLNSQSSGWNNVYNYPSSYISLCNQTIYMINSNPAISDDDKASILAEVRGVRAFWYYTLCDHYGNVPIVTDFLDKNQLPATKSRKEVYEFILGELNDIKDKLRDDVATPASYGKFTKGSAYTLLAKMYLNAEVWNPSEGPKWQECIDACDVVMGMPYILEPNWKTNFIPNNEVSKEAILSGVFKSGGSGIQNDIALNTLHYQDPIALGLAISPWNGLAANPDYVKAFDTLDVRYMGSFLIGPMIDPATKEVLITAHGRPLIHTVDMVMNEVDETGWGWINQEEGARVAKWDYAPGLSLSMENDLHIFRLADVYLMKAEAILRKGGSNAEATDLINKIRDRAFNDPSKLLQSATLDDVYKERRLEFAWEGYTRQDMIRFGTFLAARPPFKPWVSDPKCLLFPIPQEVIDANNNIIQNPGY
jgi:hypothetical protein